MNGKNGFTPNSLLTKTTLQIELVFRLATESDLPKLEWMGEFSHFREMFQHTYQDQRAGRRLMVLACLNDFPIGQIFILLQNPAIWSSGRDENGYLYALRVMTPFRGLGIGTALIQQAESLLRERQIGYASIAVAKDNPQAKRLYERLDYHVFGDDEGRWSYTDAYGQVVHVHEPCWLLEKDLQTKIANP